VKQLLWYDDDHELTLRQKVARAAARYRRKFGQVPNLCYVHPSAIENTKPKERKTGPVEIRAQRETLRHHFLIGLAE
jgi:hypothetical protein